MPHEVIMPALGMAQDSGLIVAWLKAPGAPVSAGEPLFEVETDKATMEVEAPGDGYLTDVVAEAGANVPVGQRIAFIAETPEGVAGHETPACAGVGVSGGDGPPYSEAAGPEESGPGVSTSGTPGEALPTGHNVIMPVLGMAQDSGLIVAWTVAPGDRVVEGDILFEVETDKSTMEVEAQQGGYVAALLAEAGEEVPTGQTIAILTDAPVADPIRRSAAQGRVPDPVPSDQPAPDKAPAKTADSAPKTAAVTPLAASGSGRILASPKARRLALKRGLDLRQLVDAGVPQPFHAADIDGFRVTGAAQTHSVEAAVPAAAAVDLLDSLAARGQPMSAGRLAAILAAGAARAAGLAGPIAIALAPLNGAAETLVDPDMPTPGPGDPGTVLGLRDLTASRLTALRQGGREMPVVTLARSGDLFSLRLDYAPATMSADTATALMIGLAERLEEPLRQLL